MTRPGPRIALYGYLGSGNIGNDASLETVLAWLQTAAPPPELTCITIAPDAVTSRYGIASVPLAFRSSLEDRGGAGALVGKLLGRLVDLPRCFLLAGRTDAVIVPGMGVLEETLGTRPWGLPFWLFLMAVGCRLRGRRFVLLDVGASEAQNLATRWLYGAVARLASHASYRDPSSAAVMTRTGAGEPDGVAPDLAFGHPTPTVAEPVPGRIVVGVMAYYGRNEDALRGAQVRRRYVVVLARALAELVSGGHHVVLVGGDEVDADVAREVQALVRAACPETPPDAVVTREAATFDELTEEMRRAEVVIASRFHNLICALRLARPTVSVGYAEKSRDLMRAVGVEAYCQDIEELDSSALVSQVQSAVRDAEALSARIRSGASGYATEVHALLERVGVVELGLAPDRSAAVDVQRDPMNEGGAGW